MSLLFHSVLYPTFLTCRLEKQAANPMDRGQPKTEVEEQLTRSCKSRNRQNPSRLNANGQARNLANRGRAALNPYKS